jgi:prepilin-type processing-associated H-X9-DG protein
MRYRTYFRQRGFTMFELIVILALLAVLLGLLLPVVQKVREAAVRIQCANNIHQLALAMHDCASTYEKLPPAAGSFPNETSDGTFHFYLLPYIEQDILYTKAGDGAGNYSVWNNNTQAVVIKTFLCPADGSTKTPLYENWLAYTNYACNFMAFGNKSANLLASFPDGTSNTMAFAERYQMCNGTPTAWGYTGETDCAPVFAYSSYAKFQVRPTQSDCNPSVPQSIHNGGIQVGMADGSVRTVIPNITARTWLLATDPADGQPLGADW